MGIEKRCSVCGREDREIIRGMCPRHLQQYEEYGECQDMNNLDEYDVNEIFIENDIAKIQLYDQFFNPTEEVIIDLDSIELVEGIIWKRKGNVIVGSANQYNYILANLLMDTNNKINYLDGNILNNRKSNLDVINKKNSKHHFHNKHKNRVIVTALGNSMEEVTGSCFAIEYTLDNGNRDLVLLECGAVQTNVVLDDYISNKKMVENIPFNLASHIFIMHSHSDHIGLLPACATRGFNGKIVTNFENEQIMKPMLLDASFIHGRNVTSLNNRGKKYETLFDESDVYSTLAKVESYDENEIIKLNSNLSFRFLPNNHCVGASQLELFIKKPSGRVIKIGYTSDLGSNLNQKYRPYAKDRVDINKCNLAIFESTYGENGRSFTKKQADEEMVKFKELIEDTISRKHRILIPTFSFDRAQSIMTFMYDTFKDDPNFKNVKFIVDSRLLNEINNTYRLILDGEKLDKWNEVMNWKNFVYVEEFKKTEIFASDKDNPAVIISSSGMMSAGHVTTYAKYLLPRQGDVIAFIGYCSPNTIGGKIQRGDKSILIDNVKVQVRCKVVVFHSFTGHAQQSELIQYMKNINCDHIYLHHGSQTAKDDLKFNAEEAFLFSNISKKIHIINKRNNQIYL